MNSACATFAKIGDDPNAQLFICTAFAADSMGTSAIEQIPEFPVSWEMADGSRAIMEKSVREALLQGKGYPNPAGEQLNHFLGWSSSLDALLVARPDMLKLTFDSATCRLLPEVAPTPTFGDEKLEWLDCRFPIYRTLHNIGRRQVTRCADKSLAILYQDEEDFTILANELRRSLGKTGLRVNAFMGSEFCKGKSKDFGLLYQVFREHRAVLFLGHLRRPEGGRGGGWKLTGSASLSMDELSRILGSSIGHRAPQAQGLPTSGGCVPEVVFASCCSGAWGDPAPNDRAILYPEIFLDAGVRHFIGTWMDVNIRSQPEERIADRHTLEVLIAGFFKRWARQPDHAVKYLYEAKKEARFHLLTSLYQIYSAGEAGGQSSGQEAASPADSADEHFSARAQDLVGALVSGLKVGDRIGDYRLESEIWSAPYGRTFWAEHITTDGTEADRTKPYLVQVPMDEWQINQELGPKLAEIVHRLGHAQLGSGHLTPSRHESVDWCRKGRVIRKLHVLVYERPPGELPGDWVPLGSHLHICGESERFPETIRLGSEIGRLLAQIHARQILHGNLDPTNVLLKRSHDPAQPEVVIKDTWVKQLRPERFTEPRYAAPEESTIVEGSGRFKADCWGLGVILFELATGRPPLTEPGSSVRREDASIRTALGAVHPQVSVPESLERVVSELLAPSPTIRPSAAYVAQRLQIATLSGGDYVGELAQSLTTYVAAGQRLFAVLVDDVENLVAVLRCMAGSAVSGYNYRLYEFTEDEGLRDLQTETVVQGWIRLETRWLELASEAQRGHLPPPLPPLPTELAGYNAGLALRFLLDQRDAFTTKQTPILLVRGTDWWLSGTGDDQLRVARLLKTCQYDRKFPVIIIADSVVHLEEDLARSFSVLQFPPPSPAELFGRLLSATKSAVVRVPEVSVESAVALTGELYPCSERELTYALRLCALEHGVVDHRLIELRDAERAREFNRLQTVTYVPHAKLPEPEFIGVPNDISGVIEGWAKTFLMGWSTTGSRLAPRRILVSGPSGCGKTTLAQILAKLVKLPLLRVDATRCLQGGLGQSERALREALQLSNNLNRVALLFDNVDQLFKDFGDTDNSSLGSTLTRMSAVLLEWLDQFPVEDLAILTATDSQQLPSSWRRRIELTFHLAEPSPVNRTDKQGLAYRSTVLRALFRKYGLDSLSRNGELMTELARKTNPPWRANPLRSPAAKCCNSGSSLLKHQIALKTGADIEAWITETVLLACSAGDVSAPESIDFWREAAE